MDLLASLISEVKAVFSSSSSLRRSFWILSGCLFLVYALQKAILMNKKKRLARENGCAAPRRLSGEAYFSFGIRKLQQAASSIKQGTYLELTQSRFNSAGNTYASSSLLGGSMIDTCEPKNIQTMLAYNFEDWSLGENRKRAFSPLLGQGIFASDGEMWEKSRRVLKHSFAKNKLSRLDVFESHFQTLVEVVNAAHGEMVDLSRLFFSLTLDTVTEILLGESCNSLREFSRFHDSSHPSQPFGVDSSSKELQPISTAFGQAFDRCQRMMADNLVLGWLGPVIAGRAARKQFNGDCNFILKFVSTLVDKVPVSQHDRHGYQQEHAHHYTFLQDMLDRGHDPEALSHELVNLLVAGRDTTASLLGNLWFVLAREPQLYSRLRTEIISVLGSDPSSLPSLSELKGMKLLRACINEVLRLFPPVPVNSRTAVRDTILPSGGGPDGQHRIFIPEGTRVGYNTWALHRREDIWGPTAGRFIPDRWLNPSQWRARAGWEFLPFSGGARICLGQNMALDQACFISCRLIQHFSRVEAGAHHNFSFAENSLATDNGMKLNGEAAVPLVSPSPPNAANSPSWSSEWKESLTLTCSNAGGTWCMLIV